MRRIVAAMIILFAACASWSANARINASARINANVRINDLPIPPVPPDHPPLADIAPIPDEDARAPVIPTSDSPSVDVKFFHARRHNPSLGFAPGSEYETNEDRRPIQPPGFTVSVPLK